MACARCGNVKYGSNTATDFYPHCGECDTCLDCRGTGMEIAAVGRKKCANEVCRGRGWWRKEEKQTWDNIQRRKKEGFRART